MSPPSVFRSLSLLALVACLILSPVAAVQHAGSALADGQSGSPTKTAAPGDGTRVVNATNTSNYLVPEPGSSNRQAVGHNGVDVAAAVAISSEKLHSRHDRNAFDRALANARSHDEQIAVVNAELEEIEQEIEDGEASQRTVLGAYTNRSISTNTLLRSLARIDAAADGTTARLERVRRAIDTIGAPTNLQTRRWNLEGDLLGLGGPASSRLSDAIAGRGPATDAYVSVSGNRGLVVSTVENGWLYREALAGSQFGGDGSDHFNQQGNPVSVAYQRALELYPWTHNNTIAAPYRGGFGNRPLYYVRFEHSQGDLTVYLDGRTEGVFHERQKKRVAAVPLSDTIRQTNDTLAITANTTIASGPLELTVERTDTGNAADATVRIDGTYVGKTGADGTVTTVQPARPFTVNATTDNGESVEVSVGS